LKSEKTNDKHKIQCDERRVLMLKSQNTQMMKKIESLRSIVAQQKKIITQTQNSIGDMQQICKEYAIKDDKLEQSMKNIKLGLKHVIEFERKRFNETHTLNQENEMFGREKDDAEDEEGENVVTLEFNK
jgi:hypothetical protein